MPAEFRTKSRITMPKEIVTFIGLNEGDKSDICEKDGVILMTTVTVYPKRYLGELQSELSALKQDVNL